jgi:hypothetical protein
MSKSDRKLCNGEHTQLVRAIGQYFDGSEWPLPGFGIGMQSYTLSSKSLY